MGQNGTLVHSSASKSPPSPSQRERVAIFTGTFDPVTLGHEDIIQRLSPLFDTLIVGLGVGQGKAPLFSLEERMELIRRVSAPWPNVKVEAFQGLAVNFARAKGAQALIRGLRSNADYAYEIQMASMNRILAPEVETLLIPTRADLSHVSSTLAKEIARHGGDAHLLVSSVVAERLKERLQT